MKPVQRLISYFLRIFMVLGVAQSLFAQAATTNDIQGVWILDVPATERAIYATPPYSLARGFAMYSSYARMMIFEIKDDAVIYGMYGKWNIASFKLTSQQDGGFHFSDNKMAGGGSESLVIYPQGDGKLRISVPSNPPTHHMIWKRIQLDPSRTTPADIGEVGVNEWVAALQRIQKVLDSGPLEVAPLTVKDPQLELGEAVRKGLIRKATAEDVGAFRNAYIEKKYLKRGLPVPEDEDALSITLVDISRAYVVLKKFTYPSGLVNKHRVVFLVPIGVPEPSGEYGHSVIYYFDSLTVECTLERMSRWSCK